LAAFLERWHRSGGQASWSEMKKIYREEWIDDWYQDDRQRAEFRAEGMNILKLFYRQNKKNNAQIYFHQGELWLEKGFQGLFLGHPFQGKIDRVDQAELGLELIDYKIGSAPDRLSFKEKEQLLLYQLAAERIMKIRPAVLTLYYLADGRKMSFVGQQKDLSRAEQKMKKTMAEIQKSNFPAKPGFHCRYCDFKRICCFRR